jgi:hypothetical protein
MKRGIWFGFCLVLGVLFVISSMAQEGILWVDKFSEKKGPGGIPEGWDLALARIPDPQGLGGLRVFKP